MKFILIPLIVCFLSQSIKFIIRLIVEKEPSLRSFSWVYQWAGGTPSTHSAMLASALYLVGENNGFDSVFAFCVVVSLTVIYNLVEDKKKQEIVEKRWKENGNTFANKIFKDGKLLDISGHTYFEIMAGITCGVIMAIILSKYVFL